MSDERKTAPAPTDGSISDLPLSDAAIETVKGGVKPKAPSGPTPVPLPYPNLQP